MITAFAISFVLVALTLAIHYEVLRSTSNWIVDLPINPRTRMVVVLALAMLSHLLQVVLYAAAYLWMIEDGSLGDVGGIDANPGFADLFYFSITSYTTLGIGDLFPHGAIRIVSGIEALNGLVLVGWTASFTYLKMERYWRVPEETARDEIGTTSDD
ncbi:potassium channel family protein [Parerythrobacter aestuarii]|uniref:potassium channel family protein n=1 Tax=Parerythrobacter aestuarii TaxID=3020909 RepID=UPI0024DE2043|nr:potassium channel family protein [Parerythrobacter aestuarii]